MKKAKKTTHKPEIVLSVRSLLRHPDPSFKVRSTRGGVSQHRKTQSAYRRKYKSFRSEVALQAEYTIRGRRVQVRGRLDGLYRTRRGWKLVEIKPEISPSSSNFTMLEMQEQLRYYAALVEQSVLKSSEGRSVTAELAFAGWGGHLRRMEVPLENATQALLERLEVELDIQVDRQSHLRKLRAAWPSAARKMREAFRPLQLEMSDALSDGLSRESAMILASPPGTGKTRAVLWAGLNNAIARGGTLAYFTAKTTGAKEVLATLRQMGEAGLPLRVVWLRGRAQLCESCSDWPTCDAIHSTHEALVRGTLAAFLIREDRWMPETLESLCHEKGLCLYELNREAARLVDVVIADEYFFFESLPPMSKKPLVLIDEVHQIPERLRQHVETHLSTEEIRSIKDLRGEAAQAAKRMLRLLDPSQLEESEDIAIDQEEWARLATTLRFLGESQHWRERPSALGKIEHIARWIARMPKAICLQPIFQSGRFSGFYLLLRDHRAVVQELLGHFSKVIGFSGTLPEEDRHLRSLLGFPVSTVIVRVGKFEKGKIKIMIIPEGRTKYPPRLTDFKSTVRLLTQVLTLRRGVYLVFGQNEAFIRELSDRLTSRGHLCVEMAKGMKEETLRHLFSKTDAEGFILAPLGGQFAEAVNLPTELLTGVIVLGPGIAPPTVSNEFRRQLLDNEDEEGFEEIYVKPAMARVVQAVGRLSRGPEASGVALLIGERFANERYLRHLPPHWYSKSPRELICHDWKREIRNV